MIPLADPSAQRAEIREELDGAIAAVFAHSRFVGGPEIEQFEEAFGSYCGVRQCVGVSSGTDALTIALRAADIGPGDEVITTAMTFIATVEAITEAGARPVLVDPDPDTALMSVAATEKAITSRTAAIVVVHLYGQTVDLDGFRALADRRGLLLLEDAAQAHGALWRDRRAGSVGDAAAFSFFPGKNLGALGDAGAVTTSSSELAERMRCLRNHGRLNKHHHAELGINARLDTIQAAALTVKIPHLDGWNERRRRHAAAYDICFESSEGIEPIRIRREGTAVYHQYVVRLSDRDLVAKLLSESGIATGVHYPASLARQPALAGLADPDAFPNADQLASQVLSIPVFPELSDGDRSRIAEELTQAASGTRTDSGRRADLSPAGR